MDTGLEQRLLDDVRQVGQGLLDAMPQPTGLLTNDLEVVAVNRSLASALRVDGDVLAGRYLTDSEFKAPPLTDVPFTDRLRAVVADECNFCRFSLQVVLPGRGPRTWAVDARLVELGSVNRDLILISIDDTTSEDMLDTELERAEERVHSLTTELALAEERQKRRVAIDLHDGPIQTLVLLQRKLASLRAEVEREHEPDVRDCVALAERALDQTRSLSAGLSPPTLYDLGLVPALQWLTDFFRREHDVDVSLVAVEGGVSLQQSVAVVVFRCIRELLINAMKHARASEVVITVARSNEHARIIVRDTGPGFDADDLGRRTDGSLGLGLLSIREQIRAVHGVVDVYSSPGEGSRITIAVPLADG